MMKRMYATSEEIARELCRLTGEDPKHVRKITVVAECGEAPVVAIERNIRSLPQSPDEMLDALRKATGS